MFGQSQRSGTAIPLPDLGSRAQWAPQPDVAVKGEGCLLTGNVGRTKAGGESVRAGGKPRLLPGSHSSFGAAGFPWPDLQLVLYLSAKGLSINPSLVVWGLLVLCARGCGCHWGVLAPALPPSGWCPHVEGAVYNLTLLQTRWGGGQW